VSAAEEYTPTTEQVRFTYASQGARYARITENSAVFDRWLAKHDAEVKAEALRDFGFWLEKNIASPAAHVEAYARANQEESR
jgi:hypothetical protein